MPTLASIVIDIVFIAAFFYALSFARPELDKEEVASGTNHHNESLPGLTRQSTVNRKSKISTA